MKANDPNQILFISSNFPPVVGGSSVVYDQICRNAAGGIIALAASRDRDTGHSLDGAAEHDATCGYPIYRAEYLRPPQNLKQTGRFRRWTSLVFVDLPLMCAVLAAVSRLLIQYRIQAVCIGELVSLGWLVWPLRYVFGRTVIIYTHGEEIAQDMQGYSGRLRHFYLSHANGIVSVSLFCKSLIVSRYQIDPAKIAVIPNGVDLGEFFRGTPDAFPFSGLAPDRKIILAVCRLVERKGLDRLIAAMPSVLAKVQEAHCVIVGEGPLAGELSEQIRRGALGGHVSLWGKASSGVLANMYRAATVFALPCRTLADGDTEGFGLVFLEAGACGKPVVAGAAGGTIEAVIDQETGLVVEGGDPTQIANAIIRLLEDPGLACRLGDAGLSRARGYTWQKAASSFVSFALCGRPVPAGARSYPDAQDHAALLPTPPMRLLVTVDVEESFDWSKFSRKGHNVSGLRELEVFQSACQSLGVSPIYLQTHSVLSDEGFKGFFRKLLADGQAEAGTHLHGWTTPPYWEEPNVFNSYQCNLPESVEWRKLENLTRRFAEALGTQPLIHRAGRWGGSERTASMLKRLGYRVDLSPSSRYFEGRGIGPDFQNLDGAPFWSDAEHEVLVVPASSLKFGRGPEWISTLRRRLRGLGPDVAEIEGTAVRFSPEGRTISQLKSMARQFARRGDPVLVLSLHSSSLISGGNPYSRSDVETRANLERTKELLSYCIDALGMRPTSCKSLFEEARAKDASRSSSVAPSNERPDIPRLQEAAL